MISSHLVGLTALLAVVVGWIAVQRAWARTFPDAFDDPDVLAERVSCHGCACPTPCAAKESS